MGTNGSYEVKGAVPIAVDPDTGKTTNGLLLGRGTVFEINDKIKWFGQLIVPKTGQKLLFVVVGLKNGAIDIVHISGEMEERAVSENEVASRTETRQEKTLPREKPHGKIWDDKIHCVL